jgi:hypothetical protein
MGMDPLAATLVGMGESIARGHAPDAYAAELILCCCQTDLDVSEAFSMGKSCKS